MKHEKIEAEKEALRQKYQDVDLPKQLSEWNTSFEEWVKDFETELKRVNTFFLVKLIYNL